MLKKKTPETIPATLTLEAQGEKFKLPMVYKNLNAVAYDALVESAVAQANGDQRRQNAIVVLGLIESWESEYDLTVDGLLEAEDDRPYTILALLGGFFEARQVQRVKN
jgi:hypothetical protein